MTAEFQIEKTHHAETQRRLDAAYAANDSLKRALNECGCTQVAVNGGVWVNERAMELEADLHALRAAVRKVREWSTGPGPSICEPLDEAERAAWDGA